MENFYFFKSWSLPTRWDVEKLNCSLDESPTTNTPEKFAHLVTKLKKENSSASWRISLIFAKREKFNSWTTGAVEKNQTGLANFRPISHSAFVWYLLELTHCECWLLSRWCHTSNRKFSSRSRAVSCLHNQYLHLNVKLHFQIQCMITSKFQFRTFASKDSTQH